MCHVSILCIQMFVPKIWEWGYGKLSSEMGTRLIRESVDSLCRDGADAQYMQYLSKAV